MQSRHKNALPLGFLLQSYRIKTILGHGGFGITYLALDEALNQRVAIKEYLPNEFAVRDAHNVVVAKSEEDRKTFQWGLERFSQEARMLERFDHPNIVRVLRFMRLLGTAYLVMEYRDGKTLKQYMIDCGRTLDENTVRRVFLPILDGLRDVHQEGLLHRDIKPGNIFLRGEDLSPMLIDFGSARFALGEKSRSLSVIVSAGYAPFEQYSSSGKQGPWTDVYGVGACLYFCITGGPPPEASERGSSLLDGEPDPYVRLANVKLGNYSQALLNSVDDALAFRVKDRLQSAWKFQRLLKGTVDWKPEPRIKAGPDLEPHSAPAPTPRPAQRPTPESHAARLYPTFVLVIGLIAAGAAVIWFSERHPDNSLSMVNPRSSAAKRDSANNEPMTSEQKAQTAEMKAFDEAGKKGTAAAYQAYLDHCSYCIDKQQARLMIQAMTRPQQVLSPFEKAGKEGTKAAYQAYLNHCAPDCGDANEARAMIEKLPDMVLIQGDRFRIGSPGSEPGRADDEHRHWVRVVDFYLGTYEVTNADYARFLNGVKRRGDPDTPWFQTRQEDDDSRINDTDGFYSAEAGYENHPVTEVSWYGATAYTDWLSEQTGHNYHLPTEAQWEFAARAGSEAPFYSGRCITTDQANYDGRHVDDACDTNSGGYIGGTTPVGAYAANPWGLLDIIGNVMEWTCSEHDRNYRGNELSCTKTPGLPVLRGGSWESPPKWLRSANRYKYFAGYRHNTIGFRIAREK